jgi:RNA polymerase-binding transcription factor DksA
MDKRTRDKFRSILIKDLERVEGTARSLEEEARMGTGGDAAGNLSNAPMHLGDLGSAVYTQELGAALLENEGYLLRELHAAVERLERGSFGTCENCGTAIPLERLEAIPHTRYCTACAEQLQAGAQVNLNRGRPGAGNALGDFSRSAEQAAPQGSAERVPAVDREAGDTEDQDVHAAGTAGGGTAVGGLAGTNVGSGEPDDVNLEEAMGSGNFDQELEGSEDEATPYAGPQGGAVGGTPAEKRATGGKRHQ